MSDDQNDHLFCIAIFCFFSLISGKLVNGDSLDTDKQVLLSLKSFLEGQNVINRGGSYTFWNEPDSNPCNWPGISCDVNGTRVTGINLTQNSIAGEFFGNFSALTELGYLDLSANAIGGPIPEDLGRCQNLKFLNLSHNLIDGELNLTGLKSLEVLDLTLNRIGGNIRFAIPTICNNLVVANISNNNFTGDIGSTFVGCSSLKYLDLSTNKLTGGLWTGFDGLIEFSLSENNVTGTISSSFLTAKCSLRTLDLSENLFFGLVPREISNCKDLIVLNLWGNNFTGPIPKEIGAISGLQALYLGSNNFSRDIPNSLVGLSNLTFLDVSGNKFGGDIQDIFGQFKQVRFLLLHANNYTGGLYSSGILQLPNISRLDLSSNNFCGPLPIEVSRMASLRFLILAHNQFTGEIPSEYGDFQGIQAIDLSFNRLSGSIPSSLGKLSSLLWLMLANNEFSGEIPPELGNCSSLLWLNLANNQLSGSIPPQLTNIGADPRTTFLSNRQDEQLTAGSGECLTMRRWIPADYFPFSFVYRLLTRKKCRSLWNMLLTGNGLFPVCASGSNVRTGYLQLSGNLLSGMVPLEIGNMHNFSMLHLGINQFYGKIPAELVSMSLVVLNLTQNKFSGEIPSEIGTIKCLQNLDLSYNNFSGAFPASFNNLIDLRMFNISYNPYISGVIPPTGQWATFEKWSFLGDPLLNLRIVTDYATNGTDAGKNGDGKKPTKLGAFLVFLTPGLAFLLCGVMTLIVCRIIGRGGFGTVCKGVLPDGREVKKLQREGIEGERQFQAEMEVLSGNGFGWPHSSANAKADAAEEEKLSLFNKMMEATDNLNDNYIIGRGSQGTIYKVTLGLNRVYAVKKFQYAGIGCGSRSMITELDTIGKVQHRNLIRFEGFWFRDDYGLILFSYMENGSLHDVIHSEDFQKPLEWNARYGIALGIAQGLSYLHFDCDPPILHGDVKSKNILLDSEFEPHISDFGHAMLLDGRAASKSWHTVSGTVGYIAPENLLRGKSKESDVYAYGVVLLELITRKKAVDPSFHGEQDIVSWVRSVWTGQEKIKNVLDPSLVDGSFSSRVMEQEVTNVLLLALSCTRILWSKRPSMRDVVNQLRGIRSW